MKPSQGFSLIELMIALSLSSLVLALSLGVYLSASHCYQLQNTMNEVQQNAKTAMTVLNEAVRKSGNIGCLQLTEHFPLLSYPPYSLTIHNKLQGSENELSLRHAAYPSAMLKKQEALAIYVDSLPLKAGDILIISDCRHAELFKAQTVSHSQKFQKITPVSPLHYAYDQYAEISRLEIEKFYVEKTPYKNSEGFNTYSLFKEDGIKKQKIELASYIHSIHFSYLFYRQGKLIELPVEKVDDWSKIKAVSIKLELEYPPIKTSWYDFISLVGKSNET